MNLITHPTSGSRPLALGARARCRSRLLAALVAAMLATGVTGSVSGGATAAASDGPGAVLPVGHSVKSIDVRGSAEGEHRTVDVHLWYPARRRDASASPRTVYRSALHGRSLIPGPWAPLSWSVEAEIAREGAAIDPAGKRFPVIVFSHGSVNDPIDYAHTLELIAAAGFVVAAPYHVNNTQDDGCSDASAASCSSRSFAGTPSAHPVPTRAPSCRSTSARSPPATARSNDGVSGRSLRRGVAIASATVQSIAHRSRRAQATKCAGRGTAADKKR